MTQPTDPTPPPPRLSNLFAQLDCSNGKIGATIPNEIYDYFFRHLLAGPKGPCQALISHFFNALYHECTVVRKIPQCYDPDNYSLVAGILLDINFRKPEVVDNPRTPTRRRAPAGNSKRKGKSPPSNSQPGAA